MARGGHNKIKSDDVERKCIVTGEVTPTAGLIRFVVGPENLVYPDILGKLPAKLWTPEGARYFGCFSSEELGLAFGRGSVIHGALSTGKLSNRVVEEATKLRGLREIDGDDMVTGKDKKPDER